jgi:hypothetical protein
MTGPQGAGVFASAIMIPSDIGGIGGGGIFPIEFVWAFSSTQKTTNPFPALMPWLPGDYMIVAWWDSSTPSLSGLPIWMNRLDGRPLATNPALFGGFIPDFYGLTQDTHGTNWGFQFTTNLSNQTGNATAVAVYRNVSDEKLLNEYMLDRLNSSPLDDLVDAAEVVAPGGAILLGVGQVNGAGNFLFQSPAVHRLSDEFSTNSRFTRVYDQLAAVGDTTFQTVDTTGFPSAGNDNNYFWNLAVNAGPDLYTGPYPAIALVGTSSGYDADTSVTPVLPGSRQAGDLIIITLCCDQNVSFPVFTGPSNWKKTEYGSAGRNVTVFMKRDNGFETDPTFTSVSNPNQYVVAVYRNVGAVNFLQSAAGSTLTPALVTAIDNQRIVAINRSEFYQPVTLLTANGYTQRVVQNNASDGGTSLSDKVFAGVGTTVDFPVHTAPNTGFMTSVLLSLVPGEDIPVSTPTVTINQGVDQDDPSPWPWIAFDVEFSEAVAGFVAGDITIGGTAPGTKTATIISLGSGRHFQVFIGGMTGAGTVTVSIAGSAVTSVNFGTNSAASTSDDDTVTYDPDISAFEIWLDASDYNTLDNLGLTTTGTINDKSGNARHHTFSDGSYFK